MRSLTPRQIRYKNLLRAWKEFYKEPVMAVLSETIKKHGMTESEVAKMLHTTRQHVEQEYGSIWKDKSIKSDSSLMEPTS